MIMHSHNICPCRIKPLRDVSSTASAHCRAQEVWPQSGESWKICGGISISQRLAAPRHQVPRLAASGMPLSKMHTQVLWAHRCWATFSLCRLPCSAGDRGAHLGQPTGHSCTPMGPQHLNTHMTAGPHKFATRLTCQELTLCRG